MDVPAEQAPSVETVTVKFQGGSLRDYAEAIQAARRVEYEGSAYQINIVLPLLADKVKVPPLSLIDADVESALRVACDVAENKDYISDVDVHSKRQRGVAQSSQAVYVIQVRAKPTRGVSGGFTDDNSVVRVFTLRAATEKLPSEGDDFCLKAETILTAIDTGLSVAAQGSKQKAVVRYHADSGLLFVQGTRAQSNMVSEVLASIETDVERMRARARAAALVAPQKPAGK